MNTQACAFLFDLDGTLSDSENLHLQAWCDTLSDFGFNFDQQTVACNSNGGSNKHIINSILGNAGTRSLRRKIVASKEHNYRRLAKTQLQPVAGAVEFVMATRELGISLALVTNAPQHNVDLALECFGLQNCFDCIVCEDASIEPKPSPQPFDQACQQLGVSTTNAYVFEDSTTGLLAANEAGCNVVGIGENAMQPELIDLWFRDFTMLRPQQFSTTSKIEKGKNHEK